jgi:hypothetical protein
MGRRRNGALEAQAAGLKNNAHMDPHARGIAGCFSRTACRRLVGIAWNQPWFIVANYFALVAVLSWIGLQYKAGLRSDSTVSQQSGRSPCHGA